MASPRPEPPRWRLVEKNRSEEHTSELQSQSNLVCRLLLEKKKKLNIRHVNRMTSPFCCKLFYLIHKRARLERSINDDDFLPVSPAVMFLRHRVQRSTMAGY